MILIDTGSNGWNLESTGIIRDSDTHIDGSVEESKGKGFFYYYGGETNRRGGSTYNSGTTDVFLPPDGCCIEIIAATEASGEQYDTTGVSTGGFTVDPSPHKGYILLSINGNGTSNEDTLDGAGTISIGIIGSRGRPIGAIANPSEDANKFFITYSSTSISEPGSGLGHSIKGSGFNGSHLWEVLSGFLVYKIIHLNMGYTQSSYSDPNLEIVYELFVDGTSYGTHTNYTPMVINTGANTGRIPVATLSIGGFPLISGQTPIGVRHSTGTFRGNIDQVRIFDSALTPTEITTICDEYGFPIPES